jgi:isopentenyl-diphosphate delta-isomerase
MSMGSSIRNAGTLQEQIILVNGDDEEVGYDLKTAAHRGEGRLHRAFSVYLFDSSASLLLQRRSYLKPLWPGCWSNSCCSHPRPGEATHAAASRRVREELGLDDAVPLNFLFKFQYHARFQGGGAEHEVCSVFAAAVHQPVRLDPMEVAEIRYVTASALDQQLQARPEVFTPWLRIAWAELRARHWDSVVALVDQAE